MTDHPIHEVADAKRQKREAQAAAKRRWPRAEDEDYDFANPRMVGRRIARSAFRSALKETSHD